VRREQDDEGEVKVGDEQKRRVEKIKRRLQVCDLKLQKCFTCVKRWIRILTLM